MINALIRRSWWVLLFVALCLGFHFHGMHKKNQVHKELKGRMQALQKQKEVVLQEKDELQLQVDSQTDPAYIEMLLKQKLGVVPEGQTKVYFTRE